VTGMMRRTTKMWLVLSLILKHSTWVSSSWEPSAYYIATESPQKRHSSSMICFRMITRHPLPVMTRILSPISRLYLIWLQKWFISSSQNTWNPVSHSPRFPRKKLIRSKRQNTMICSKNSSIQSLMLNLNWTEMTGKRW
jgi:hypothetical protein